MPFVVEKMTLTFCVLLVKLDQKQLPVMWVWTKVSAEKAHPAIKRAFQRAIKFLARYNMSTALILTSIP